MPRDAFISHASVDAGLALAICQGLETRGLTCWIAPRDVRSEGTYGTEIIRGLRECATFLIVLTAASSESQQVEREAERASHYQKRIIPLSVGGGEPGERLEFYTAGRQRVACATTIDDAFLDRLAAVIRGEQTVVPERPHDNVATVATAAPRASSRPALAIAGVVAAVLVVAALGLWLSGALTGRSTPPNGERPAAPASQPQPNAQVPGPTEPAGGATGTGPPPAAKEPDTGTKAATPPAAPPSSKIPEGRKPDVPAAPSKPESAGRATASGAVTATRPLTVNGVTLQFAAIPGGTFRMGCQPGDSDCSDDEKVKKTPTVEPFQIGVTEVTQSLWQATMGENPSDFQGALQPVENVSWQDAKRFVEKLNERRDGFTYALPTEEEWEYAARANGSAPEHLANVAWFGLLTSSNPPARPQNVKTKEANAWGLFDMLGNVAEWCEDWFSPNSQRVVRGGAWTDGPTSVRFSARGKAVPSSRTYSIGVRLVRTPTGS